jgi:hypothetical protein
MARSFTRCLRLRACQRHVIAGGTYVSECIAPPPDNWPWPNMTPESAEAQLALQFDHQDMKLATLTRRFQQYVDFVTANHDRLTAPTHLDRVVARVPRDCETKRCT